MAKKIYDNLNKDAKGVLKTACKSYANITNGTNKILSEKFNL